MSYPLWYIRHMIMNEERQAKILLNNEVKVTDHRSQFCGRTGIVTDIMADGRTLEIDFFGDSKQAFLDVTLVSEIQERTQFAKTPQSLGPVANHLVKDAI
jgi:ribosomal protein L21E